MTPHLLQLNSWSSIHLSQSKSFIIVIRLIRYLGDGTIKRCRALEPYRPNKLTLRPGVNIPSIYTSVDTLGHYPVTLDA